MCIWHLQSKCFFLGAIISSVVALHTDLASPWPAKLWRAAKRRSFIVCPAIFILKCFFFQTSLTKKICQFKKKLKRKEKTQNFLLLWFQSNLSLSITCVVRSRSHFFLINKFIIVIAQINSVSAWFWFLFPCRLFKICSSVFFSMFVQMISILLLCKCVTKWQIYNLILILLLWLWPIKICWLKIKVMNWFYWCIWVGADYIYFNWWTLFYIRWIRFQQKYRINWNVLTFIFVFQIKELQKLNKTLHLKHRTHYNTQ